jgi:hypothetical protein
MLAVFEAITLPLPLVRTATRPSRDSPGKDQPFHLGGEDVCAGHAGEPARAHDGYRVVVAARLTGGGGITRGSAVGTRSSRD